MFNDSVKLTWQGKEYDCPITMDLVKTMERNGVNILQTRIQLEKGGIPPVSLVAEMFSYVLNAGGCYVTEQEIYTSIMGGVDSPESMSLLKAALHVSSMFFPQLESAERTEAGSGKK
jgi:hypothetical protein